MKKVLLVAADGFSKTGVPSVFMNVVRNLSREGYTFDIIYFDERFKYYYDEFCSFGGKTFLFDKQHKSRFLSKLNRYISSHRYYKKTLKLIKDNGPYDAIHCFKEYRSGSFLKAAQKAGIDKRIYHSNNVIEIAGNFLNRALMHKEKKECLKYGSIFVGCSKKAIESAFGSDVNGIVLNNPYDENNFYFSDAVKFDKEKIKLVQTAGFCDGKNQLFSLEVTSELLKMKMDVEMNFIGMNLRPAYKKILDDKINELGLKEKVIFHDFDTNQKNVFDKCNYFLFPSKTEAFGIVLIEAQACGLKCFASTEVPEEANVGGCLRIPLTKSPKEWAEIILKDFNNTTKKEKYDCSNFINEKILKKYKELYEFGGINK